MRTLTIIASHDEQTEYLHNVLKEGGCNTFPEYEGECPSCKNILRSNLTEVNCPGFGCDGLEPVRLEHKHRFG